MKPVIKFKDGLWWRKGFAGFTTNTLKRIRHKPLIIDFNPLTVIINNKTPNWGFLRLQ